MTATRRASGIPLMDDVSWGAHLCVFYETLRDLADTAAGYFEAGLQSNELCVWLTPRAVSAEQAADLLRDSVEDFDCHVAEGRIAIVAGGEPDGRPYGPETLQSIWSSKLEQALAGGYAGLRGAGDSSELDADAHGQLHYERGLGSMFKDKPVIALCTYSLVTARALDVLDVLRVHNLTVARRSGEWQFMETPELQSANAHIRNLDDALAILSRPFPGHELLTERERIVLAFLVKGASSKEAARDLGISPRTVDFHRANIIDKLGARNTADAIRRVLSRA